MFRPGHTYNSPQLLQAAASAFLCLLLLLLTSLNYLQYNNPGEQLPAGQDRQWQEQDRQGNPAGTDEKPAGNAVSLNEEYSHEVSEPHGPLWISVSVQYPHTAVHRPACQPADILSPPPEIG